MKTAIMCAIVVGILNIFFVNTIYIIFSIIVSIIKNFGKDEFVWYGQPIYRSYANSQPYDSFWEMVKDGFYMNLSLCILGFVLLLGICIYIELKG